MNREPLRGVTLTIDVDACGIRRACRLASIASNPDCVLKGTVVIAVVRWNRQKVADRRRLVELLTRHGFDSVVEAGGPPLGPLSETHPTRTR